MNARKLFTLIALTFILSALLAAVAGALTCTDAQKAAILEALPPCGEDGGCASIGDVSKGTGMGALVCRDCLNQMMSEGSVATCTLPGPPIQWNAGWCRQ